MNLGGCIYLSEFDAVAIDGVDFDDNNALLAGALFIKLRQEIALKR
jgi:hypothetical protein